MNEHERKGPRALGSRIQRDLDALAAESRNDTPSLEHTMHILTGRRPGRIWEDRLMQWTRGFSHRPRLAAMGATLAVAATLLVVPISYDKVVGHEVTLTLSGDAVNESVIRDIASQYQEVLGAETVQVGVTAEDGVRSYRLEAAVPDRNAAVVSRAFARTLAEKGYAAEAAASPIKERVSGNVYAMAYDNVIRVDAEGKTAGELETEIAAALAAAGVPNATVQVTLDPNMMKIEVQAEGEGSPGELEGLMYDPVQLQITHGDQELDEGTIEEATVRVMRSVETGSGPLTIEMRQDGTVYTATVEDAESLDDAALAAAVRQQFAAQGVEVSVTAVDGRIQVSRLGADAAPETGVRPTTWGKLKHDMKTTNP